MRVLRRVSGLRITHYALRFTVTGRFFARRDGQHQTLGLTTGCAAAADRPACAPPEASCTARCGHRPRSDTIEIAPPVGFALMNSVCGLYGGPEPCTATSGKKTWLAPAAWHSLPSHRGPAHIVNAKSTAATAGTGWGWPLASQWRWGSPWASMCWWASR